MGYFSVSLDMAAVIHFVLRTIVHVRGTIAFVKIYKMVYSVLILACSTIEQHEERIEALENITAPKPVPSSIGNLKFVSSPPALFYNKF